MNVDREVNGVFVTSVADDRAEVYVPSYPNAPATVQLDADGLREVSSMIDAVADELDRQ